MMGDMSRRVRVVLGLGAAIMLAIVLAAPVAFRSSGGKPCARTIAYGGRIYTARAESSVVQSIAIGVGVASGCGAAPANVNVRSVSGVAPSRAIALPTETSTVYVRRTLCRTAADLLACLQSP